MKYVIVLALNCKRESMSILIVEDNPVSAKMLELNLKKQGYQTNTVTTGIEALEFLDTTLGVQLVIADIMMPEMDGLGLLQKMNERPELRRIPVILCTARKDSETVQKALDLGCTDYVLKPVSTKSLLTKVTRIIKEEKPVLTNKHQIRLKLSIDHEMYKKLDATFSNLVFDKITLLEEQQEKNYPEDITGSLLELLEGAILLGAERLKVALERLKARAGVQTGSIPKGEYGLVLNELKSLQVTLLSRPMVKIHYELPEDARVTLRVEKHQGPVVRRLVDEDKPSGQYEIMWDGRGDLGERLAKGLYVIHLKAGSNVQKKEFRLEEKGVVVVIDKSSAKDTSPS